MSHPVLEVRGVTKRYGEQVALRDLELEADSGDIVALVGANGAGKSTLTAVIAGLLRPDAGQVCIGGRDLSEDRLRLQRRIGLAPQEIGVYPRLSVRANLELFAGVYGLRPWKIRARVAELADALLLGDVVDRLTYELSGGQKRRLHTAIALVHEPDVVLLDEPTAGADAATRAALLLVVKGLAAQGALIVYTTHYLQEVEQLGARVVIIDRGTVVATGDLNDLLARHAADQLEIRLAGEPVNLDRLVLPHARPTADGAGIVVPLRDGFGPAEAMIGLGDEARRVTSFHVDRPRLEDVVADLTREQRDVSTTEATGAQRHGNLGSRP